MFEYRNIELVLVLDIGEASALAVLLHQLATGHATVETLAPNEREALMQLYADTFLDGFRLDAKIAEERAKSET